MLDHLGSPPLATGGWNPWADAMSEIAQRPNVVVKLSGLGTCADPQNWDAAEWQPYVDHVLTSLGATRLMVGSDWPVSTLAGTFAETWSAHVGLIAGLSREEREAILLRTAERTYSLVGFGTRSAACSSGEVLRHEGLCT